MDIKYISPIKEYDTGEDIDEKNVFLRDYISLKQDIQRFHTTIVDTYLKKKDAKVKPSKRPKRRFIHSS